MRELCERIKDECDKRGRSLSSVMMKAGLSASIVYKWKDGTSKPKPQSIRSIAEVLGIPAKTLAPEMSEQFDTLEAIVGVKDIDTVGENGDDLVFIGIKKRSLTTLRPFIERANGGVVEVPADLVAGLVALMGLARNYESLAFSIPVNILS